jgi:hypothetical protein
MNHNLAREYRREFLGNWDRTQCAVQDNKGQHCPDEPVHYLEHNDVTIGLCARCFLNYQHGAFNKDRAKGIAREDRLYIRTTGQAVNIVKAQRHTWP